LLAAPPRATNDIYPQVPGGGPTTVPGPGILNNDTVPCPGQATIRVTSQPAFGSVVLTGNTGGFTFTPNATRDTSFTYEIKCPSGLVSKPAHTHLWHTQGALAGQGSCLNHAEH